MEAAVAPFRLTSFVWESQPGRYVLTVIAHGTAKLAQGREAAWTTPEEFPLGYDDGQTQAARMNLLAPFKPRADVVVVGKAYAPPGGDTDRLVARVRLGDFSKAVSITGDRLWMKNEAGRWGSSPPRPFSQMLLSPERSIRSAENPVGLDPAGLPVEGRLSLPNLEPVAGSYSAIIGPVPPLAPSRRNLLNPHGAAWVSALELGRSPGPVGDGMSFAFFNVAPADQQLAEITPGSAIVLENLNPAQSMFTSRLPTTIPRVRGSDPASGRPIEPQLRCDTVWIDGDRETAWLVFRGTVDLVRPDLPVALNVALERWQAPAVLTPMPTQTMLHTQTGTPSTSAPLPFAAQRGPSFGSYAQPEGPTNYSYQGPNTARMRDESTADIPEKGSYPPPPGPKRSITAEILLEPQPKAQAQALPFGAEWESGNTGDLEVTTSQAGGGLARHDTAELTPVHATEPPPPPSVAVALPFADGQGPGASQAAPAPRKKNLQPLGSPGPIPEISETKQPELPAGLIDEAARGPVSARGPSVLFDMEKAPPSAATQPAMPVPKVDRPMPDSAAVSPPALDQRAVPPIARPPVVSAVPATAAPLAPPKLKTLPPMPPPAVPPSLLKPLPPVPPAVPVAPEPPADTKPGATVVDEATPAADDVSADKPVAEEPASDAVEAARDTASPPPDTEGVPATEPPPAAPPPEAPPATPPPANAAPPEVAASDPDPTPLPEPPAPATRDNLSLEEAAAVRAHLSVKGADKAAVLARFTIADADWARIERDHLKAIDEGVRAGNNELLDRYDDGFLATQDEIRGPIDGAGYAKIQVARERGQLGAVLDELKVARGDLLRIDRVWRRRLATDRELADRVEDEMERLRNEHP